MVNNKSLFLTRCFEVEALGATFDKMIDALRSIYLIDDLEAEKLHKVLYDDRCAKISSWRTVKILDRWGATYGATVFGNNETERLTLEAKECAFRNLAKIGEEREVSLEDLLESSQPHAQSLAGAILYYERENDFGKRLLLKAADQGDIDALLWELSRSPEKAPSILTVLANNRTFLANPQALDVFKRHYGVDEITIIEPVKLGFHT